MAVVGDAGVGGLKVDTQAASAGGQNETKLCAPWCVEGINRRLAVNIFGVAVDTTVLIFAHVHKVFEDVEDARHLSEDEHAASTLLKSLEGLVQHVELATVLNKVFAERVEGPILDALEKIRVAGALAELHNNVQDGGPILLR